MKQQNFIFKGRRWKLRLAIGFVALLLVLNICLYPYVPPIIITVVGDSDSVAVTSNINLSHTYKYISKRKIIFGIENEWLRLEGYTEAIPVGPTYTIEHVQDNGGSVTVTVDPTYITAMITGDYRIALPDSEQAREHYHDDKPPVYIPDNRRHRRFC